MLHTDFIHVDHTHFFIGDTHLGHAGILDMAMRPYKDITEHDRDVVTNWNSVVRPTDTVWHLGDFAWDKLPVSDAGALFKKLNGVKRLIKGNHDTDEVQKFDWASTHDMVTLKADGTDLVLFHYPLREWPGFYSGALHPWTRARQSSIGAPSLGLRCRSSRLRSPDIRADQSANGDIARVRL